MPLIGRFSHSLRPAIPSHRTGFIASCEHRIKWVACKNNTNASDPSRLSFLYCSYSYPPHHPLSLCTRLLLPHPPLFSLRPPCSPSFRHPLSLMTTVQASSESHPSSSTKTVRVVIKGRVQGVFYRNWTVENASQLGLKGWVRNRRDGSVEALFSGNSDAVQEMEQRCRRGPPDAMVTGLQVFPSDEDPGIRFERRLTV